MASSDFPWRHTRINGILDAPENYGRVYRVPTEACSKITYIYKRTKNLLTEGDGPQAILRNTSWGSPVGYNERSKHKTELSAAHARCSRFEVWSRFRDVSNIAGKVRLHPSKWMSLTRCAPPSVDLRSSFPPGYQPCSAFGNKFKQVTSFSIQVRLVLHRQDSPSFLFRKQRWRHCIARVLEADNFHPTQVLLFITRKETIQSSLEIL